MYMEIYLFNVSTQWYDWQFFILAYVIVRARAFALAACTKALLSSWLRVASLLISVLFLEVSVSDTQKFGLFLKLYVRVLAIRDCVSSVEEEGPCVP